MEDGEGGDDRRPAAFVVFAVAAIVLPSSDNHLTQSGKPANPTVGIAPWRFALGSVCVPFRLRNPPNPPGIGLMKGTPQIALLVVDEEALVCLVRASIPSDLLLLLLTSPSDSVVVFVDVHSWALIAVTTTKTGERRRVRRSAKSRVRLRRPAPRSTHSAVVTVHAPVAPKVEVTIPIVIDATLYSGDLVAASAASRR